MFCWVYARLLREDCYFVLVKFQLMSAAEGFPPLARGGLGWGHALAD
jgi:hypothetical protein